MTGTPFRAGVYGRESHDKTKSVDEQTVECERDAVAQGWVVTERYADGISASRFARKARKDWPKLLADIEAGELDAIVIWESSRGDRTLTTWSALLDLCRAHRVLIRVTSHAHTYSLDRPRDWRSLAEDGVDSSYESEKTSMRLRRAMTAQAEAGKPHGRTRYGYERLYHPTTKQLVEERPDPNAAPIVQEIVRRVGHNDPVTVIAADLERRGVPAPAGDRWTPRTIRAIATSEAYIGIRVHKGERHAALWPALVTEAEHLAAGRVLADPKRKTTRPGRQKWLLSYLARCGVDDCGRHVHRVPHHSRKPELARYACERGCSSINAADLDEFVAETVCKYLAKHRLALRRGDDAAVLAARAEAEKLQGRLNEWRDSGARGETSPASLARIETQLLGEIADAQRRSVGATVPAVLVKLLDGVRRYREIRDRFDDFPVPAQREVIDLVADIRIHRSTSTTGREPFDWRRVHITWK